MRCPGNLWSAKKDIRTFVFFFFLRHPQNCTRAFQEKFTLCNYFTVCNVHCGQTFFVSTQALTEICLKMFCIDLSSFLWIHLLMKVISRCSELSGNMKHLRPWGCFFDICFLPAVQLLWFRLSWFAAFNMCLSIDKASIADTLWFTIIFSGKLSAFRFVVIFCRFCFSQQQSSNCVQNLPFLAKVVRPFDVGAQWRHNHHYHRKIQKARNSESPNPRNKTRTVSFRRQAITINVQRVNKMWNMKEIKKINCHFTQTPWDSSDIEFSHLVPDDWLTLFLFPDPCPWRASLWHRNQPIRFMHDRVKDQNPCTNENKKKDFSVQDPQQKSIVLFLLKLLARDHWESWIQQLASVSCAMLQGSWAFVCVCVLRVFGCWLAFGGGLPPVHHRGFLQWEWGLTVDYRGHRTHIERTTAQPTQTPQPWGCWAKYSSLWSMPPSTNIPLLHQCATPPKVATIMQPSPDMPPSTAATRQRMTFWLMSTSRFFPQLFTTDQ